MEKQYIYKKSIYATKIYIATNITILKNYQGIP